MPLSAMQSWPRSRSLFARHGGGRPSPWYQTRLSGGGEPRAGNSYVTVSDAGANSGWALPIGDTASIVRGERMSNTWNTTSLSWPPRSLIVPLPKSHHRYQRGPGRYVAWNGRIGAGPIHRSQWIFGGTGIASLKRAVIWMPL